MTVSYFLSIVRGSSLLFRRWGGSGRAGLTGEMGYRACGGGAGGGAGCGTGIGIGDASSTVGGTVGIRTRPGLASGMDRRGL